MKTFTLALLGLCFGIASAYFWWRSSRVLLKVGAHIVTGSGPVVTYRDLEAYLKEVGGLNAWAAACGAVGVLLSTIAGVIGALTS